MRFIQSSTGSYRCDSLSVKELFFIICFFTSFKEFDWVSWAAFKWIIDLFNRINSWKYFPSTSKLCPQILTTFSTVHLHLRRRWVQRYWTVLITDLQSMEISPCSLGSPKKCRKVWFFLSSGGLGGWWDRQETQWGLRGIRSRAGDRGR